MVCRYLPNGNLTFANIRFKNCFQLSDEMLVDTNVFLLFSPTPSGNA